MSIATTSPAAAPRHAPAAPHASGAPGMAAIDPIKLLNAYKWILLGSLAFGALFGTLGHYALQFVYPTFKATATYEIQPVQAEAGVPVISRDVSPDEIERFMNTQLAIIKSDRVLGQAARDTRLEREAPSWVRKFRKGGRTNTPDVQIALLEDLGARMIPNSYLIEIGFLWRKRTDVAGVVSIVHDAYMRDLTAQSNRDVQREIDSLQVTINQYSTELTQLADRRDRLLRDFGVDSIDTRFSEAQSAMSLLLQQLSQLQMDLEALDVQRRVMAEQLASEPINYPDVMRAEVEVHPIISGLKQAIITRQLEVDSLRNRGLGEEHRSIKEAKASIEAATLELEQQRRRLLLEKFNAQNDFVLSTIEQLRAQQAKLFTQQEELRRRLNDLAETQAKLEDIERETMRTMDLRSRTADKLANLESLRSTGATARVVLVQAPVVPTEMHFPKMYIMIPAGMALCLAIAAGFAVMREILDQRVKGPSDVAIIPRTRVLGVIPHASEDPTVPERPETVFRDADRGVLAESFRQLRTSIHKSMVQSGHKSLMIVSGMPESGTTSITVNLGYALSAMGQRVLLIDANLRRPSLHVLLELPEAPGLADLLADEARLDEVIRRTSDGEISVITAGAAHKRVCERLGTRKMADLLAEAGTSFDIILLDCTPAVVAGDALALTGRCDAAILVTRALSEKRGMVARLRSELAEGKAEFLGVVVNGVRASVGGYFRRNIQATHEYQNGRSPA